MVVVAIITAKPRPEMIVSTRGIGTFRLKTRRVLAKRKPPSSATSSGIVIIVPRSVAGKIANPDTGF